MTSVTFDPAVGGDGSTVSDDADPDTGLANGGHRTRFVPSLSNIVSIAQFVLQKANEVAAMAAAALGGTGSIATSTTTLTIGAADHAISVGTGKTFAPGQKVGVARTSAAASTAMYGTVIDYTGSTLTVRVGAGDFVGSGTFSDWTVAPSLYGPPNGRTISAAGLATGGGDLSANRTITVTAATATDLYTGTSTTTAVPPKILSDATAPQSISYASTIAWDTNVKGPKVSITLGGNPNISAPTNLKDGWPYTMILDQGAAGNRTINSWDAIFEWGSLGAPVLSTGANKVDMLFFMYLSATGKLHLIGFRKAA